MRDINELIDKYLGESEEDNLHPEDAVEVDVNDYEFVDEDMVNKFYSYASRGLESLAFAGKVKKYKISSPPAYGTVNMGKYGRNMAIVPLVGAAIVGAYIVASALKAPKKNIAKRGTATDKKTGKSYNFVQTKSGAKYMWKK